MPEPVYPTYVVGQSDYDDEPVYVVSVNKQNNQMDQADELLKKLLEALTTAASPPIRTPEVTPLEKLTQLLISETVKREPAPPTPVEPTGLEALLQTYFTGQQSPGLGPRFRQLRRNWADVKCFSCGKTGHSANRCPKLDVTFPFILPGWKSEKTPNGYLMISPKMAMDRRRAENEDRSGGRGLPLGSVIMTDPMIQAGGGGPLWRPNPQNVMTRNVARDTNINRYDEPVKTSVWKTEIPEPGRWQDTAMVDQRVKNCYSNRGV